MASEDDPPVYSVDDLEDDEDNNLVYDDTSSNNNNNNLVTVADPNPTISRPNPDKPTIERVLFQRLWTDEDEIELLRGFLDFTSQKKGVFSSSHHLDTAAFYDQIKNKLQLDFNKNQLVEKLRRLKKKYRTAMGKISSGKDCVFKTPHDQATFEISKKIWFEPTPTRIVEDNEEENPDANFIGFFRNGGGGVDLNLKGPARPKKRKSGEVPQFNFNQGNNTNTQQAAAAPVGNPVPGLIEETVRGCLTPIFKELVDSAKSNSRGFGGVSPMGFDFGGFGQLGYVIGADTGYMRDDKWRKQHILELEVYSKRLELVQDQIKLAVEELTKSL